MEYEVRLSIQRRWKEANYSNRGERDAEGEQMNPFGFHQRTIFTLNPSSISPHPHPHIIQIVCRQQTQCSKAKIKMKSLIYRKERQRKCGANQTNAPKQSLIMWLLIYNGSECFCLSPLGSLTKCKEQRTFNRGLAASWFIQYKCLTWQPCTESHGCALTAYVCSFL